MKKLRQENNLIDLQDSLTFCYILYLISKFTNVKHCIYIRTSIGIKNSNLLYLLPDIL